MSGDIIKEFLVGLGFSVDQAGMARFNAAIAGATKAVVTLAAEVEAAAAAVVAGTAKIADGLEQVYFASVRTGAAAENIKALGFAAAQAGAGVGNVQGSLEGVARFMRSNPGSEGFISALGVKTKDANGQLRDTSAIMGDLGKRFAGMQFFQAQAYAGVLGIDERTLMALRSGDIAKGMAEYADLVKRSGLDMKGATEESHGFMSQLRSLGAVFDILATKVTAALSKAIGGNIQAFREVLLANIGRISDGIAVVSKAIITVASMVTDVILAVGRGISDLIGWYNGSSEATQTYIKIVGALTAAFIALNSAFLASPIGLVLALGTAIGLLWEDYKVWKEGGTSLIDWSKWEPSITAARDGVIAVKDAIVAFWVMLRDDAWPAIKQFVADVRPTLTDLWVAVRGELKAFWDDIKGFYENLRDVVWPAIRDFCGQAGPAFKALFGTTVKEQIALATAEINGFVKVLTNTIALLNALKSGDWEGARKAASALYGQSGVEEGLTTRPGSPAETLKNEGLGGLYRRLAPTWLGGTPASDRTVHPNAGAAIDKRASAQESFDFWKSKGFTDVGAAAMVATEQRESKFDPAARGDGNAAHGLYQHHADRRAAIKAATGIDMSTATAAQQRDGMYQEMVRGLDKGSADAYQTLRTTTDFRTAAGATVNGIERPADRSGAISHDALTGAAWLPLLNNGGHAPVVQSAIDARVQQFREQAQRAHDMMSAPQPPSGIVNNGGDTIHGPTVNQTTNIHVEGGDRDAAERIGSQQERQTQLLTRNLQGATR